MRDMKDGKFWVRSWNGKESSFHERAQTQPSFLSYFLNDAFNIADPNNMQEACYNIT